MQWSWDREGRCDNWGNGLFQTREEAIENAKKEFDSLEGVFIYVGQCEVIPMRTDADPDRIMEELNDYYHAETGCDDYVYENVSNEDREWLELRLADLMAEFHIRAGIEPGWYRVENIERVQLG